MAAIDREYFTICCVQEAGDSLELGLEAGYDTDTILRAAERHFRVRVERPLGRIPLWVLDRR